ncbi:hypothetical protein GmHk_07G020095 [Glycine max]|nr:hypothetical protein GmHk_07G020095 [Glycine max]
MDLLQDVNLDLKSNTYYNIRAPTSTHASCSSSSTTLWSPPISGSIKCNLDATIFKDQNSFNIEICLRDDHGSFIKARTEFHLGIPQA